jgi:phytoene dehydrogenase-like protein
VAANYLARAGLRVTVLERRGVVGGACVTEELVPGARFSTCAYVASSLRPQIIRELELERFGLDVNATDVLNFVMGASGERFFRCAFEETGAWPMRVTTDKACGGLRRNHDGDRGQ